VLSLFPASAYVNFVPRQDRRAFLALRRGAAVHATHGELCLWMDPVVVGRGQFARAPWWEMVIGGGGIAFAKRYAGRVNVDCRRPRTRCAVSRERLLILACGGVLGDLAGFGR